MSILEREWEKIYIDGVKYSPVHSDTTLHIVKAAMSHCGESSSVVRKRRWLRCYLFEYDT